MGASDGRDMSRQMYGADADELERLAQQFVGVADDIDAEGSALTGLLNRISWLGDIASSFIGDWTGVSLPKIGASTSFLRESAADLQRQANEQRKASDGDPGKGKGKGGRYRGYGGLGPIKRLPVGAGTQDPLVAAAEKMVDASPAERAAWWQGLSDEERSSLLEKAPGVVMVLDGLPPDVLAIAKQQYQSGALSDVVISDESYTISGDFGVKKFLRVGGEAQVDVRHYDDGSVEVTVTRSLYGEGGIGVGSAEGKAGASATYRFPNESTANMFLAGLPVALGMPSFYDSYRGLFSPYETGTGLSGGARFGAGGGSGSESVAPGVSVDVDKRGAFTYTVAGDRSSARDIFNLGGPKQLGVYSMSEKGIGTSLTTDWRGNPSSVSFTTDSAHGSSFNGSFSGGSMKAGSNVSQQTTISWNLNDPLLAPYRDDIAAAIKRGNPGEAAMIIKSAAGDADLLNRATVTKSTYDNAGVSGSASAAVRSGGASLSGGRLVSVSSKAPGGKLTPIYP